MQGTKQAVFMLGEEEYSFDIMDINTVEKVIPIRPMEGFTKCLKGIINLRGSIVPVYSLRKKFGMDEIPTDDDSRFIVLKSNGFLVAYEVDRMKEILQLEEDQVYETPALIKNASTSYIKAITKVDNRLIVLLNYDGILSEEEKEEVRTMLSQEV